MTSQLSPTAQTLHQQALVWDNHGCLSFSGREDFREDFARYRQGGITVAAVNIGDADFDLATLMRMAARIRRFVKDNPADYLLVSTADDILEARRSGRLGIFLDVEGVYAMGEDLSLISLYYDLGVRWMLMVYNWRNLAGSGCLDEIDHGLTPLGYDIVREMDRVGMIKCCSHTGYRTAMDIMNASDKPTIFSHSNPRALKDHPRNIPDDLMKACAATGGVIGINGVGIFLGDNDISAGTIARHIDYAVQLVGPDHVALGLDYAFFDEGEMQALLAERANERPSALAYRPDMKFYAPEDAPRITDELLRLGYGAQDIRAILGENLLRVARAVWT